MQRPVIPTPGTKPDEIDQCTKRGEFEEHPSGHVVGIFRIYPGTVRTIPTHLKLVQTVIPVRLAQGRHVVSDDSIPILSSCIHLMQDSDLLEMLDVERHAQQDKAKLLVKGGKETQLGKVQIDVLAVPITALALREQLAV